MAAPPIWDHLSQSSKQGLRYAWAAAMCRADGTTEVTVNSFDFLIGLLLSHPGASEAEQTFRRFGLVAGQALPASYPDITPDQLERNLVGLPTEAPPMDSEVLEILNRVADLDTRNDSMASQVSKVETVTEMRYLWVALLNVRNEAQSAIRTLLTGRGVNFENLTSQSQAWLATADRVGYDTVLQEFTAVPVDIVNYKADQSRNPDPAADPTRVEDFVGISAEVDAFAYLLASRNLQPPLAVGLFGDWGSGKSYFLDAIKRRIDQLTRNEELAKVDQRDTPFWKRIVQVDFNAWHYIEGDLWSSLVDNILGQLNLASENRTDDVVVNRREYLLEQIKNKTAKVTVLAQQQQDLEHDLERNEAQLRDLRANQRAAEEQLEAKRTEHTAAAMATQSRQAVMDALAAVELGPVNQPTTLGDAAMALDAARTELNSGWSLFRPFVKEGSWTTVLVLVCLVFTPLLAVVVAQQAQSLLGGALTGVSTLIAAFVGSLGAATRWLRARNQALAEASQKVDAELKRVREAKQSEVDQAEQVRDEARAKVVAKEEALNQTQAELVSVQNDLSKAPQVVLNEFLRARLDAGEYRKRLGVPAIVRDDFKDLAELISYQNEYLLRPSLELQKRYRQKSGADILPANDPMIINRIILYIDDLDRCPDSKVIEVLQAVHLLLAFPLFVVVVAVDARWLAHALQSRYPALAGDGLSAGGRAVLPNDYLEKIFQVPFWVDDLTNAGRASIVRGLLSGHVTSDAGAGNNGQQNGVVRLTPETLRVLSEMIAPRTSPPRPDVTALQVRREELEFLERLTPLMGRTPRSVKRFVNLYQLLKVLRLGRAHDEIEYTLSDEYLAAFLLAVAEGLPTVGGALMRELVKFDPPTSTLQAFLQSQGPGNEEVVRLTTWLAQPEQGSVWQQLELSRLVSVADDVQRFLFRRVELTRPDGATAFRPQLVHIVQDR